MCSKRKQRGEKTHKRGKGDEIKGFSIGFIFLSTFSYDLTKDVVDILRCISLWNMF